jgi:hypothetical protein
MTDHSMQFSTIRLYPRVTVLTLCFGLLCGCASNTIDQAVPLSNVTEPLPTTQPPSTSQVQASPSNVTQAPIVQPKDSGQYPNINVVPNGEIAQLSDAETAATRARLEGEAQVQQQRGESPEAYLARLRNLQKLGNTHAADTLRQIEQGL